MSAVAAAGVYPVYTPQNNASERTSSEGSNSENEVMSVPETVKPSSLARGYTTSEPRNLPFSFPLCSLNTQKDLLPGIINVIYEVYVVSKANLEGLKQGSIRELRLNPVSSLKTNSEAQEAIKAHRIFLMIMDTGPKYEYFSSVQMALNTTDISRISRVVITDITSESVIATGAERWVTILKNKSISKAFTHKFDTGKYTTVDYSIYKTTDLFQAACLQVLANAEMTLEQRSTEASKVSSNEFSCLKSAKKDEADALSRELVMKSIVSSEQNRQLYGRPSPILSRPEARVLANANVNSKCIIQ